MKKISIVLILSIFLIPLFGVDSSGYIPADKNSQSVSSQTGNPISPKVTAEEENIENNLF